MNEGKIDVLNTGHGHLELKCDPANPVEMDRAKRAVADMLRRGYVLFVEGGDGALIRVEQFDEKHGKYIVSDVPGALEWKVPEELKPIGEAILASAAETRPVDEVQGPGPVIEKKKPGRKPKVSVPMEKAKVTAIGRSAGG